MSENIEIVRSVNMPWAFTYKKNGSPLLCDRISYAPVIELLSKYGFVKFVEYEQDSKNKTHIHGIVMLRKGFFRKRLCIDGFNCCLNEIYDEKEWARYCRKDKPQTECKDVNDNTEYMF